MKIAVVVPTYNEVENIEKLIESVLKQDKSIEIYIVDDNSPDGTGRVVDSIAKKNGRVHCIHRKKKEGLGRAYRYAFKEVFKDKPDYVVQMDADFSHDPKTIVQMINGMKTHDVVIGSRYVNGISVINWSMFRILLSWGANQYARFITRLGINDVTGGFKCFKREVLESINFDKIHSEGYCFQIEVNYVVSIMGYTMLEIPIIFKDRTEGSSKMAMEIILESFFRVLILPFKKISDYAIDKTAIKKEIENKQVKQKTSSKAKTVKKKTTPKNKKADKTDNNPKK